jgi:hypothetical protein
MTTRLRWWVIPAALVVLVRVVTLPATSAVTPTAPATGPAAVPAIGLAERVVLRDASGARRGPVALPAAASALLLECGAELAAQRVQVRLWRCQAGAREAAPWLEFVPVVPAAGVLPIAGLAPGSYDLEVRSSSGDVVLSATGVAVPGRWPSAPAPSR